MSGISVTIQGGAGISARVTTKQVAPSLQVSWDDSTDPEKNTFVDANEDEILTFTDNALPISVGASGIFDIYETLGDGLTLEEKYLATVFFDRIIANGNNALIDNHTIYPFSGANSLVDYIGGKVSTLVNAPTHSVNGYAFDGTNYINTNFNPLTDKNNSSINDVAFSHLNGTINNTTLSYSGTFDGVTHLGGRGAGVGLIGIDINSGQQNLGSSPHGTDLLMMMERNSVTNKNYYSDGIFVNNTVVASASIPSSKIYVGARNNNGVAANFTNGTIKSYCLSASIGFNHLDYNTNLRALLTGLGALP